MSRTLISWIGNADIEGASNPGDPGPLLRILEERDFDSIYLLYNQPENAVGVLKKVLTQTFKGHAEFNRAGISSPIHFGEIYQALDKLLSRLTAFKPDLDLTYQLTSGTPAMAAVSILVGKAKYPGKFIQASREHGVQDADLPFDIAADFFPALVERQDSKVTSLFQGVAPLSAAFDDIITQNPQLKEIKEKASVLSMHNVPVLILGESGTGKELFAKAIHNASPRASKPLLTLNCGAIPKDLIDANLFGHIKGAYTGATTSNKGYFTEADGGTLFLDEFGELPLESQVRLLRVLQDGTYSPVGSTKELKSDVRIIAATNKNLLEEVAVGRFREDLFYRVAIGVLHLPPLRDRHGDLILLADKLLEQINRDMVLQPGQKHKKLSVKARKFIQTYAWPGNIRELHATLLRATLWHSGEVLSDTHMSNALVKLAPPKEGILERDISQGIDINQIISEVYKHYIGRALEECDNNKSRAAELLGLKNYQTLNNWMDKYGIK